MICVPSPLSLRQVGDILFESGIDGRDWSSRRRCLDKVVGGDGVYRRWWALPLRGPGSIAFGDQARKRSWPFG